MTSAGNAEWRSFSDRERPENFAKIGPHKLPEARVKRNNIEELKDMLFAQLERLGNEELSGEALQQEIARSQAVGNVATQIINCGALMLKAGTAAANGGLRKMPKLLE